MSISGSIEDFPLKDVLQIVSFSRKSGTLKLKGPSGEARIVFKAGAVVHASSPGSHAGFGALAVEIGGASEDAVQRAIESQISEPAENRRPIGQILLADGEIDTQSLEQIVQSQISVALRQLLAWEGGTFVFDVHKVASPDSFGVGFEEMVLEHGLDVQRLLLEAMKYFDDRAREEKESPPPPPVEVPPHPEPTPGVSSQGGGQVPAVAEPRVSRSHLRVLALHDDGRFRDLLIARIGAEGLQVEAVADPSRALELATDYRREGLSPVILAELGADETPSLGGKLLKVRTEEHREVPIMLLTDPAADAARKEAFSQGIRHLLTKPSREVGQTDHDYENSIMTFAVEIAFQVKAMVAEERIGREVEVPDDSELDETRVMGASTLPPELREFLKMLRAEDAAALTLKLLDVIGRRYPRAILMHMRGGQLVVKGAFGTSGRGTPLYELLRDLHLDPVQCPGFEAAFESAEPRRMLVGPDVGQIPDIIGPPANGQCLVIPILCHFRPVGLIYADTGESGAPVGETSLYRELCNRVSEVLGEAVLRRKGRIPDNVSGIFRRPSSGS